MRKLRVNPRCHHDWRCGGKLSRLLTATQGKLFLLFYPKFDKNIFSSIHCVSVLCSDSILKLLKRVYKKVFKSSFLFSCKTLTFLFLPFLNLGAIGMCSQNRYTNLKSALDQPFSLFFIYQFSELNELCKK